MIKEAYVSFEIAKLLKEKGFNEKCEYCYAYFDDNDVRVFELNPNKKAQILAENRYPCVTQQFAMAWLREKHKLYIGINIEVGDVQMLPSYDFEETLLGYSYAIYNEETLIWVFKDKTPRTYEEAVEAALKYCLENLI